VCLCGDRTVRWSALFAKGPFLETCVVPIYLRSGTAAALKSHSVQFGSPPSRAPITLMYRHASVAKRAADPVGPIPKQTPASLLTHLWRAYRPALLASATCALNVQRHHGPAPSRIDRSRMILHRASRPSVQNAAQPVATTSMARISVTSRLWALPCMHGTLRVPSLPMQVRRCPYPIRKLGLRTDITLDIRRAIRLAICAPTPQPIPVRSCFLFRTRQCAIGHPFITSRRSNISPILIDDRFRAAEASVVACFGTGKQCSRGGRHINSVTRFRGGDPF